MTEAICLIVLPVAFVGITIGAPKLSFAICLVIEPLSLVLCTIRPFLLTISALLALLVHIARIVRIFCDLQILDIGQLVLFNHFP